MSAAKKFSLSAAQDLYAKAHAAGLAAGNALVPVPMLVSGGYAPVMDGVCGFAWINIKPASGPFVNWLKHSNIGHKAYGGGYNVWVSFFNQSMSKKEAYAAAFAKVLNDAGIVAYADSKMD